MRPLSLTFLLLIVGCTQLTANAQFRVQPRPPFAQTQTTAAPAVTVQRRHFLLPWRRYIVQDRQGRQWTMYVPQQQQQISVSPMSDPATSAMLGQLLAGQQLIAAQNGQILGLLGAHGPSTPILVPGTPSAPIPPITVPAPAAPPVIVTPPAPSHPPIVIFAPGAGSSPGSGVSPGLTPPGAPIQPLTPPAPPLQILVPPGAPLHILAPPGAPVQPLTPPGGTPPSMIMPFTPDIPGATPQPLPVPGAPLGPALPVPASKQDATLPATGYQRFSKKKPYTVLYRPQLIPQAKR